MQSALPRKIRLVTGMVLFAYVTGHLLNLALGLHSLELMDEWLPVFQAPWQNPVGLVLLYGSLMLHMVFGMHALYMRRTLRMSRYDAVQLGLALVLPPLLIIHLLGTRVAFELTGFLPSYAWLMLIYWEWQPLTGLRQVLVVMVTWVHGCMSLYYWLRLQPWWSRVRGFVYPLAFLVPVASLLGFVEAGKDALLLAGDQAWMSEIRGRAEVLDRAAIDEIYRREAIFLQVYVAVVVGVLLARAWRVRGKGAEEIQVSYADGPTVQAASGLSLLEVSRRGEVPHASVCGGRGRCGTCRVRVLDGAAYLPEPGKLEQATLRRLGAADDVRLACQCVPRGSPLTIERLVPAVSTEAALEAPANDGPREAVIVLAHFDGVDALAEGRSDADTLFLVGRHLDAAARAVDTAGGRLSRADVDGVRAVFGVDESLADGARRALAAVRAMHAEAESLAARHRDEGLPPLTLAVSMQAGRVLLGDIEVADEAHPALAGEALDRAARAQRELGGAGARLLLAEGVARLGGVRTDDLERASIEGDDEGLGVFLVGDPSELAFETAAVAS